MDPFDNYQENNDFDNDSNIFNFNQQENLFYEQDYQNDFFFESQTFMQQNDERLISPPNIEDDANQKSKTEQPKSLVKTAPTTDPRGFLKKKREKEEEDKEPQSDEEKTNQKKVIKGDIFEIFKETNREIAKGRKKKFGNPGKHNKFSPDNIMRKIKTNLFEILLRFINDSIKENEIFEKKKKKIISIKPFLLKPNQEIIRSINIELNLDLLDAKLKTIFSQDVSKKVENYGIDKNKKLIEKIYNEKKQKKTIDILNMTLNQCLEQIQGSKTYEELEGLETEFKKVIENLEKNESKEYVNQFVELVNSYRNYFEDRKPRQTKKNFKIKEDDK